MFKLTQKMKSRGFSLRFRWTDRRRNPCYNLSVCTVLGNIWQSLRKSLAIVFYCLHVTMDRMRIKFVHAHKMITPSLRDDKRSLVNLELTQSLRNLSSVFHAFMPSLTISAISRQTLLSHAISITDFSVNSPSDGMSKI